MQQFISSIMATFSFEAIVIYDFLCIVRIIKKEEIVEKIWKRVFPNKKYDERQFFVLIRPIFLQVSFITYLISGGLPSKFFLFNLLLFGAPILSAATGIFGNNKKK